MTPGTILDGRRKCENASAKHTTVARMLRMMKNSQDINQQGRSGSSKSRNGTTISISTTLYLTLMMMRNRRLSCPKTKEATQRSILRRSTARPAPKRCPKITKRNDKRAKRWLGKKERLLSYWLMRSSKWTQLFLVDLRRRQDFAIERRRL